MVTVVVPPLSVPDPRAAPEEPSTNCTVPVAAAGETWAVKVTAWPKVDGLGVALKTTLEVPTFTVCAKALETLAALFPSPP